MSEWKAIFEIDELKKMLQGKFKCPDKILQLESTDEITKEVQEAMPKTEAELE